MSYEASKFDHRGLSWSTRASLSELEAVQTVGGAEIENLVMHSQLLLGARKALAFSRKIGIHRGTVVDFGCGNGRFVRYFASKGWSVVGTEITAEMLDAARRIGVPEGSQLYVIDGVHIPLPDSSVDMIWTSSVLKYALLPPGSPCRGRYGAPFGGAATGNPWEPVYEDIAREMYRVLKPGRLVVDAECWVDVGPEIFTASFEKVGFRSRGIHVLRYDLGRMEKLLQSWNWHKVSRKLVMVAGQTLAEFRYRFNNANNDVGVFRDYLFFWHKTNVISRSWI